MAERAAPGQGVNFRAVLRPVLRVSVPLLHRFREPEGLDGRLRSTRALRALNKWGNRALKGYWVVLVWHYASVLAITGVLEAAAGEPLHPFWALVLQADRPLLDVLWSLAASLAPAAFCVAQLDRLHGYLWRGAVDDRW